VPRELLSQAAYGRRRGISQAAVWKRTTTAGGPIPVHGPKKRIDPAEADAIWDATKTPQGEGGAEAARPSATVIDADRYLEAKTARMIALARREELELRRREHELVDRRQAEREAEEAGQRERAAWTAWSVRTAAVLAVALDVNGDQVADLLDTAVREQLGTLAAAARAQADGR
jgi:hypothetical protein